VRRAAEYNEQSVNVGNRVQEEDLGNLRKTCSVASIPRLPRRRLSVRREAGEQLFHRFSPPISSAVIPIPGAVD